VALWVPFAIFSALIWWMYHTLAHKPGGQPIGALERSAAKFVGMLGRWLQAGRRLRGRGARA
jgi:lipopolysaccharide export system permease protein